MNTHPKYEKSQLVSLCLQGNREAQSQLYTSYHRKMLKIIKQYVADPDLAQDVLHDGFIIILSQLKSLRDPERLDYWMAAIMKNLAIHSLSQLQFDSILEEDVEDETTEEELVSFDELAQYIDLLPAGCRTVFRLAALEGKSHKEISEMLGISPKSSASQLARAKERLRQLIRENKGITFAGLFLLALVSVGLLRFLSGNNESQIIDSDDSLALENSTEPEARQLPVSENDEDRQTQNEIQEIPQCNRVASANDSDATKVDEGIAVETEPIIAETISEEDSKQESDSIGGINDAEIPYMRIQDDNLAVTSASDANSVKLSIASNLMGFGSILNGSEGDCSMADGPSEDEPSPADYSTSVRHLMPITLCVRLSKDLSEKLSLESGLQYTLLRSEYTETIGNWSCTEDISAHFLSVPLGIRYSLLEGTSFKLYGKGGVGIGFPIKAKIECEAIDLNESFHCPIDFSTSLSIGLEYKFAPNASLFVEPSLSYHFLGTSKYPILWNDTPLSFEIPLGIRISW